MKTLHSVAATATSRTMAMPLERTDHRCLPGEVVVVRDVAPWLRRLTVRVPRLEGYAVLGPDEFVGLVLPRPGACLPDLSAADGPNIRTVVAELPEETRPDLRWYTVRAHRPEERELDIEIVLHPEGDVEDGPGASWVRRVQPGAEVAVQTGTTCYHPPADAPVRLVAGDETAYPAIAGIIEEGERSGTELHVLLEVEAEGVVPQLPVPAGGSRTVVARRGRRPGTALLDAVVAAELPALDYGWVCGEQELAASVRRHLVDRRGLARSSVYFCAYWILGRARG